MGVGLPNRFKSPYILHKRSNIMCETFADLQTKEHLIHIKKKTRRAKRAERNGILFVALVSGLRINGPTPAALFHLGIHITHARTPPSPTRHFVSPPPPLLSNPHSLLPSCLFCQKLVVWSGLLSLHWYTWKLVQNAIIFASPTIFFLLALSLSRSRRDVNAFQFTFTS